MTHPSCQRWWCWRWRGLCLHQLALREFCPDITGSIDRVRKAPSGWWVTVPLDSTPKKGGNSWISNDNSTHINSTIFIYKKYPRILVLLKVYHGVGDLVSINNMQFHRLSWSQLNSFGACYFNCFGALLEAALEVGLGRSATWDLWVIYCKHGHKWNNTRTKKIKEVGKMIIDFSSWDEKLPGPVFSPETNVKLMPQQVANPADIRMGFNF